MRKFIDFLQQFVSLAASEQAALESKLITRSFGADEIILTPGQVCRSICFLVSGSAYSSFSNQSGRQFIWNFYFNDDHSRFENHFPFDYHSFVSQSPGPLLIKTVEPTTIIELTYANATELYSNARFEQVGRTMSEAAFSYVYKRAFSLLTMSARDLYLQLLEEEPYLLDKFQHFLIASYLGIAPQSLSRLRAEITRG